MDEFKKPTLQIASLKIEKSDTILNEPKESEEKSNEEGTVKETNTPLCPYKVPLWSKQPNNGNSYSFEVLKSGQIIEEIKDLEKKAYWTFGRLPENDIEMAHPTISRFHAILQYRPKNDDFNEKDLKNDNEEMCPPEGWYIYDLSSTHGTFLNKQRIPPKVYIRIRVGHMLRLGASTRTYILQGPSEDEEPESDLSVTELKAKRQQDLEQAALLKKRLEEEAIERANNEGCSWGMSEDADEETDLTHNPYASTNNEELFLDDPKKTLRGYFEREGLELVYKCDEMSAGSFVCRVELPLDDTNGRPIVAEVVHKGKKKDCVLQCALESCRILDRHGVLRQANQEPLKRKQKSQESDSDDDEFWDRTGDVARKKQRKANANTSVTLTYEDLLKQETDLDKQIKHIEESIVDFQERQKRLKAQTSDQEDLDAFMENLQGKDTKLDKTEIRKLRLEEQRLKSDRQRVQRLIKIAKPLNFPFNNRLHEQTQSQINQNQSNVKKQQLPMIGKRNQFSKFKIVKMEHNTESKQTKPIRFLNSDEEEVEEDDEKGDKVKIQHNFKENIAEQLDTDRLSETKDIIEEKIDSEENDTAANTNSNINVFQTLKNTKDKKPEVVENTSTSPENQQNLDLPENVSSNNKKRRQRVRQRGKRQEVDMDDDVEYESSDKYAKWIPPENQTGDGMTELNKKFGY